MCSDGSSPFKRFDAVSVQKHGSMMGVWWQSGDELAMDHGYAMDMPWAKDANQEGYFVGPTIFAEVKRGMQIYVSRLRWRVDAQRAWRINSWICSSPLLDSNLHVSYIFIQNGALFRKKDRFCWFAPASAEMCRIFRTMRFLGRSWHAWKRILLMKRSNLSTSNLPQCCCLKTEKHM